MIDVEISIDSRGVQDCLEEDRAVRPTTCNETRSASSIHSMREVDVLAGLHALEVGAPPRGGGPEQRGDALVVRARTDLAQPFNYSPCLSHAVASAMRSTLRASVACRRAG